MKALTQIGLTALVDLTVNIASWSVLDRNFQTGLYSPDADSLSIPFFENAVISILIVVLLFGCAMCQRGGIFSTSFSLLFGTVATLLSAYWTINWFVPNHYSIAALFGCLFLISAASVWFPLRRLIMKMQSI